MADQLVECTDAYCLHKPNPKSKRTEYGVCFRFLEDFLPIFTHNFDYVCVHTLDVTSAYVDDLCVINLGLKLISLIKIHGLKATKQSFQCHLDSTNFEIWKKSMSNIHTYLMQ